MKNPDFLQLPSSIFLTRLFHINLHNFKVFREKNSFGGYHGKNKCNQAVFLFD